MNPDWIIPNWPAPANVHAVCTTRAGGVSNAPFDAMNLGDHVGDDVRHVAQNRALLRDAIHAAPVFLTQVHGTQVVQLGHKAMAAMPGEPHLSAALSDVQNPQGRQGEQGSHAVQADACITQQAGVACTIMVADCLPVLFTNRQGTVVGAAHAGWRGLAGEPGEPGKPGMAEKGVLEEIYQSYRALALVHASQLDTEIIAFGTTDKSTDEPLARLSAGHPTAVQPTATPPIAVQPTAAQDILVWLGPCIGPEKFEVGGEVRDAFVAQHASAQTMFNPCGPGKWLADLAGLARLRLRAMGIENIYGNDSRREWCTVSNPSRFFSHRRDAVALGGSGRMAACIWLG